MVSGNIGKLTKIQEVEGKYRKWKKNPGSEKGNPEQEISYDEISSYFSEPSPLLLYHRAP